MASRHGFIVSAVAGMLLICFVISVSSCGTTQKVPPLDPVIANETDDLIFGHIESRNVTGLLSDYKKYPDYRRMIEDFLLYEVDYGAYSYENLKSFERMMAKDSVFAPFFNSLKLDREDAVLSYVSCLDFSDIPKYYRSHPEYQHFVKPFIEKSLYSVVDTEDYAFVRYARDVFKDTPFYSHIDSVKAVRKKEILPVINKSLDQYCKTELKLLDYLHHLCINDINRYVGEAFDNIVEVSLEAIESCVRDYLFFEVRKKDTYEAVAEAVRSIFCRDTVQGDVLFAINGFISDCNTQRIDLVQSVTLRDDVDTLSYKMSFTEIPFLHEFYVPEEDLVAMGAMQDEKRHERNSMSVISGLVGLIPGVGTLGLILDGADLFGSITSTQEEAEAMQGYFEQFSEELYMAEVDYVIYVCDELFSSFAKSVSSGHKQLKDYVHSAL